MRETVIPIQFRMVGGLRQKLSRLGFTTVLYTFVTTVVNKPWIVTSLKSYTRNINNERRCLLSFRRVPVPCTKYEGTYYSFDKIHTVLLCSSKVGIQRKGPTEERGTDSFLRLLIYFSLVSGTGLLTLGLVESWSFS